MQPQSSGQPGVFLQGAVFFFWLWSYTNQYKW